mmetsp:Transcript_7368/g.11204  ORF Transcript_7368/g.11204 Transcript_7368/m.11204 type:complete len:345 (-) Transcript_7368:97-1131(-)
MSPIKKSSNKFVAIATLKFLFPLVIGVIIGSSVVLAMLPITSSCGTQLKTSVLPVMKNISQGWHPIYVYYGKDDGLSASAPAQMKQNYNAGSQVDQDRIIAALARNYRELIKSASTTPYFIDLAANDAVQLSNTLNLEEEGWTGLCVEPNPIYWYRLSHRKCAIAAAFVGGEEDLQQVEVSLSNEEYGGIIGEGMDNSKEGENMHDISGKNKPKEEKRYTVSMNTLLSQFHVPLQIDYMSLDVEGAEELIMHKFPFSKYTIRFMTVERPKPGLQNLLKTNGFQFVMMLVYWGETLWVHESVIKNGMSIETIQEIVHSLSRFSKKVPRKGVLIYNMDTGEYVKKQ